jgi:hypothetical protein
MISPANSSSTSRSATLSRTFVRLMVATSCVWRITRCGSSEWSGVSTLGAGPPSGSMQLAMNRIMSASLIATASRSALSRASASGVKPARRWSTDGAALRGHVRR